MHSEWVKRGFPQTDPLPPKEFFYETAITVDHEDGTCRVDTTMRGIAAMLIRAGFRGSHKA